MSAKVEPIKFCRAAIHIELHKKLHYPGVLIIDFQEFIYGWDYEYL